MVLRTYLVYNTVVSYFVVVSAISELPPKQSAGKECGASSRQIWAGTVMWLCRVFCCGSRQIWAASKTFHRKIMWSQFPQNLSCLQNNLLENNVEALAGTRSTLFSGGLFWDRFLLDLIKKFFGRSFSAQIDVLLFLQRVQFTRNHPIFTRNWRYLIWMQSICISFSSNWSNTFRTFNLY